MKHLLIIFCTMFLLIVPFAARAEEINCLIIKDEKNYLIKEGKNCDTRYSPASSFKIALALIGFESEILKDENHPIWKNLKPVTFLKDYWEGEKTPLSWMKYSIVWYSQMLTTKLGIKDFQHYVNQLDYGNRDLSGNIGMNDGLTESWLSSSLLISPNEQIAFIEKLAKNELPLSKQAQIKTKNLIRFFEESLLSNSWVLYGKTGTDIDRKTSERKGYFIGFATKNVRGSSEKLISFVIHLSDKKDSEVSGIYAKKLLMGNKAMVKMLGR